MNIERRLAAYLSGPAYTIWTFIKYTERSKDPAHCRRLKKRMEIALRKMAREGEVIRSRSIKNRAAFRSRSDYPADVPF